MPYMKQSPMGLGASMDSSTPMMDKPYFIDRIEDDVATIYVEGDNGEEMKEVNVSDLPAGAKEGDRVGADGTIQRDDMGEMYDMVKDNKRRGLPEDDMGPIKL